AAVHDPQALTNPHLTFHPLAMAHLHANRGKFLAEHVMILDVMLQTAGRVPWAQFVSRRIDKCAEHRAPLSGDELIVRPSSRDCSIALAVDFIDSADRQRERTGKLLDH